MAKMIEYFYYKNTVFILLLFWFQFYNKFSGSAMIPEMYLILFMLLFNSLPSMINGGFDKFLNFTTLEQNPELFENSSQNKMFRAYVFWLTLFDSIWQSLVQFYIPLFIFAYSGESFQGYGLESGSSISFYTFGTLVANASL
jgi:magnesium-transporting ATPase (P-type)